MKLWLTKLYSKFRNRSIYCTINDISYYIQPNGSVIQLVKTEEGSTIRGQRAKYIDYVDYSCDISKEDLDSILNPFIDKSIRKE